MHQSIGAFFQGKVYEYHHEAEIISLLAIAQFIEPVNLVAKCFHCFTSEANVWDEADDQDKFDNQANLI